MQLIFRVSIYYSQNISTAAGFPQTLYNEGERFGYTLPYNACFSYANVFDTNTSPELFNVISVLRTGLFEPSSNQ